jgi:adenylosuccinate lyase
VIRGLVISPERMRENLDLTYGALFSQRFLLALVQTGLSRDEAYRIAQRLAQRAYDSRVQLRTLLEAGEGGPACEGLDLEAIFDWAAYTRHAREIVRRLDTLT